MSLFYFSTAFKMAVFVPDYLFKDVCVSEWPWDIVVVSSSRSKCRFACNLAQ